MKQNNVAVSWYIGVVKTARRENRNRYLTSPMGNKRKKYIIYFLYFNVMYYMNSAEFDLFVDCFSSRIAAANSASNLMA